LSIAFLPVYYRLCEGPLSAALATGAQKPRGDAGSDRRK